jgi:hypothetical protein
MVQKEIRNIHRLLEKSLDNARQTDGKLNLRSLVDQFWINLNNPYLIITMDFLEGPLAASSIQVHHGDNIQAGFYLSAIDPKLTLPELENANPHHINNTLVYFIQVMEDAQATLVIAFRPQIGETTREILISTLKFMLAQQFRSESISIEYAQARLVQTSLFPRDFNVSDHYDIHCLSRSCEMVSGDAYDLLRIDAETTGILIADALGHGFPAALQARDVIIGIRMGLRKGIKLSAIMHDLNKIIYRTRLTSRFVSVFLGELENNGNLFYVNAGHLPPIYLEGEMQTQAEIRNIVIGPLENVSYKMGFFHINRQGVMLLFTDGITEAQSPTGEEFGRERLVRFVRQHLAASSREIVEQVFEEVSRFSGPEQKDDMTLMVIKRK